MYVVSFSYLCKNISNAIMKRILLFISALFILSGCTDAQNSKNMKTLVTYFSATGTTRAVAEQLAKVAQADLFEIAPQQPYTAADLDWTNKKSRSSVEMSDPNSRPAIKGQCDVAQYDVVYIGFPIWWYTAPTIINTFIEQHNLKGKTIRLFATSGGSTIDKSVKDLQSRYPELNIQDGRLLNSPNASQLEGFVK